MTEEANAELKVVLGSLTSECLVIHPRHRLEPSARDFYEGNWLASRVDLRAGGFEGRVDASLRAEDFLRFRDELRWLNEHLKGTARFKTMEGWLAIEIVGDGLGHLKANCEVVDDPGMGNRLRFTLNFDQTFLPPLLRALDEVISAFPVRSLPGEGTNPHPLNVPGPFYVEYGCCLSCGVPESAPEVFAFDADGQCYVHHQPTAPSELDATLEVMGHQEVPCIRYAGVDSDLRGRLSDAGFGGQCDPPIASPGRRSRVPIVPGLTASNQSMNEVVRVLWAVSALLAAWALVGLLLRFIAK